MHRTAEKTTSTSLRHPVLIGWLAALCCALLFALALPSLLGGLPLADDLGAFHYPLKVFYSQQLAAGEAFDWWPAIFGGTYITGEGQLGGYHPWHLALYSTLPVDAAFRVELWANYPLMLLGMIVLLRHWRLDWSASLFGAAAFTFGGFNLLHYVHMNAIAVVAHLPWLLWSADVVLSSNSPSRRRWACVLVSLLIGSQILFGYPQYVWFCGLALAGLCLFRLLEGERSARRTQIVRLAWLAVAGIIGLLIGGIQLMPTYDALQHSARTDSGTAFAVTGSLHPLNLMQLVAPYLFEHRVVGGNTHELGLYAGSVTLVLAVWQLCHWQATGRLRPLAIAALVLCGFSLWMAFGEHAMLYRLQTWLPVVGKFRFPCRMIVLFQFGLAVLAAIGWMTLMKRQRLLDDGTSTVWRKAAITFVVVATLIPLFAWFRWPEQLANWPMVLAGPVMVSAAVGFVTLAEHRKTWALFALSALAAADLGSYGLSYAVYNTEAAAAKSVTGASSRSETDRGWKPRLRLNPINDAPYIGNYATISGQHRIDGYAGLMPKQHLDYTQAAALRLAGVKGMATEHAAAPGPRTWLVGEAIVSNHPAADLLNIDPYTTALVDSPLTLSGSPGGKSRVVRDRPGNIELTVSTSSTQLVIVNESFHPGWQAKVDGVAVRPMRVYGDFIGIPVPSGARSIELTFQPASLRYGALASACGLGLLWIAFAASCCVDRRTMRTAP